ncbi:MAG: phosphatase PAP2 family protein [Candidatus Magasanikbacteria bacterium]|nr:phosphatase PAP2 family protein [Candidatus Magasanikbacteria bacterium]
MANYSWSKKLFLKINVRLGRNRVLDAFMTFCARWLIVFLFGLSLFFLSPGSLLPSINVYAFFGFLITGLMSVLALNFSFGLAWKHERPIIEFPHSKQLCRTWQTWKSFPSDHTALSFVLAFTIWTYSARLGIPIIAFVLAILISLSRVYVGVHYPRDILGGIFTAVICFLLSPWLYPAFNVFFN